MKKKALILLFTSTVLLIQCKSWMKKNEANRVEEQTETIVAKPDKDYIPVDEKVKIGRLSNGMTYYILQNKKPENKVEMYLALKAGSVLEDDDQLGLAHFMEHMNFNGTRNFEKNELVHFLQRMGVRFGADLNAFTSFDETVYMLPIPLDNPENLDKGLLVLHDWSYFATLDSIEIEKERGVVLEEYRLGLNAEKRMLNKWLPVALKGSRYAERLPIGKKEILENFPHEALKRFHKDWYRPDLQALVIVGDIDPDRVEAKIKEMFADIPKPENPRPRPEFDLPGHKETLIAVADDPEASMNRVTVFFKDRTPYKPPQTVPEYVDNIKKQLFIKMFENRLEDLKEQADPPFSYAFAYHGAWVRPKKSFTLTAITDAGKRTVALETLLTEAKKVKEFGFSESELNRAKKELMQKVEEKYHNRNTTDSDKLVWKFINNFLEGEPIPSVEWEYEMYRFFMPQIKLTEVNAFAKKFIHDDNRVIVVTGKKDEKVKSLTEEDIRKVLNKVDASKVENNKEETNILTLMKEKPVPGKIVKTESDDVLGTTTYYLSNGAKVTTKKTDFKKDQVLFMAFKFGGESLLDDETLKKTVFAFEGLTEAGVNGLKKSELRKVLSGKKAKINLSINELTAMVNGNTLSEDLETALQLNYLYYTALNKNKEAFESWKKRTGAFYGARINNPQMKFFMAYYDFVNQNNPRYPGIFPTPDKLEKQDYDLAYAKFREFYDGATDYHYYIVGNFDENQMEELIRTYIGGLPASARKGNYRKLKDYTLKGKHEFIYHAGKDPKSMVLVSLSGPADYSGEERLKFRVFSEILSNILIDKLREAESGVYTVRARGDMHKLPRPEFGFSIFFPCGPDNARKLYHQAIAEMNKLIDEGPTQEDLDKIKKSLIVRFDEEIKTNEFWIDYLSDIDYLDADPHRFKKFKQTVESLSVEDIKEIGKKYLKNPETNILGIWYPEGYEEKK